MTHISENYASLFDLEAKTEMDYAGLYKNMAEQLKQIALYYNNSLGEDIYMGYVDVAGLIENLSDMNKNISLYSKDDMTEAKQFINSEFKCLLMDLQNYFESYPDEIVKRDITNGTILADGFLK